METKNTFTRILAIGGTGLVWLPLLAPVLFSAGTLLTRPVWRFDYLMPAELFPVALVGGGLLLWAALRARAYRKLIACGLGAAIALLFGSQVLAVVTGLASGETEPTGWAWACVLAMLAGYALALAVIGVGGVLILRDLYRPARPPAENRQGA
jgi:hypothetical protein